MSAKNMPLETDSPCAKEEQRPAAEAEHRTKLLIAFQEIRELIIRGKLYPGTWIVEADLAKHLCISRTPVREALHRLRHEGYIHEHKNVSKSRMSVAPLTKDDGNELYSIISRIEGIAGRQIAALSRQSRLIIAEKLYALNQQLTVITKADSASSSEIFDLDRSFHRLIVNYGAGPRLSVLHSTIEPQTERYSRLYASSVIDDLHLSIEEHDKIIGAIEVGVADEVEYALKDNWDKGGQRLARMIDMFGERGSW
jgi:DNA-binding GntR family transcriptional regulator